jgi:hypothetical protein
MGRRKKEESTNPAAERPGYGCSFEVLDSGLIPDNRGKPRGIKPSPRIDCLLPGIDVSKKELNEVLAEAEKIITENREIPEKITEAYLKKSQCLYSLEIYREFAKLLGTIIDLRDVPPEDIPRSIATVVLNGPALAGLADLKGRFIDNDLNKEET